MDICVIAPAGDELRPEWLARSISEAAEHMAAEAVLWVIAPRRLRPAAERALRRNGLALVGGILTIPGWPDPAHLIPIAPATLRDAGSRHLGLAPAVARAAGAIANMGIARTLLRRGTRSCALLATRRPRPDLLRWLGQLDGDRAATATVATASRGEARIGVTLRFPPGTRAPDLVVKIAFDEPGLDRLAREREALVSLGGAAARAGAGVPRTRPMNIGWALATEVLPGRPTAATLARAPRRLEPVGMAVARWLTAWNSETAAATTATSELLRARLLDPADRVMDVAPGIAAYRERLGALARRIEGERLVLVAAHNDLTMANLLDADERISVVDWEQAAPSCLPVTDLWYALADGVARAHRIDHAQAVEALALGRAPAPAALAAALRELVRAVSLTPNQAELAFHACWLHHASNELRRGESDGPFLAVVQAIASRRVSWP
ncbi:MAG: Choline/ethanolamine kinase [Solirubrobacteraceae bacterium]|nr:Choline/ethanolamine kinase [Solirubrobacteraceae bacterium]